MRNEEPILVISDIAELQQIRWLVTRRTIVLSSELLFALLLCSLLARFCPECSSNIGGMRLDELPDPRQFQLHGPST